MVGAVALDRRLSAGGGMAEGPYDAFLSYHHADETLARRIVAALQARGLSVFFDQHEIEDFASITARLRDGLSRSKALIALYSATYPTRRACQFELTAAFLAAQRLGPPDRRVLVLNPEASGTGHIQPVQLRDALFRRVSTADDDATIASVAERVTQHVAELDGLLGDLAPLTPPRWIGMRPSPATRFVGRHAAMWEIHSALFASEVQPMTGATGPGVAQVRGLGGIGKTLLAQEYALRFGAAYAGGVFWLRAGDESLAAGASDADALEATRLSQVRALGEERGIALAGLSSPEEVDAALAQALAHTGEPFLWVVDDVPARLDADALRRWFAPHPLGRTLITTRSGRFGALATPVDPSVLSSDEAVALLALHRRPSGEQEAAAAARLAQELGHHALAVDVAGATVAAMPGAVPYATFTTDLADPTDDALELAAEVADVLPTGHSPSIAATLLGSIDALGPDGLDLLRIAAVLAPAPIPATFSMGILALADDGENDAARRRIVRARTETRHASLIETSQEDDADTVHALVTRTVRFRQGATSAERLAVLTRAAVELLNQIGDVSDGDHDRRRPLQPLIPHARHLAQAPLPGREGLVLLTWLGDYDRDEGAYASAQALQERALDVCQREWGEEHPNTIVAIGNLATTRYLLGDLTGARALEERALETSTRTLGEEHPNTLSLLSNHAMTLRAQGDLAMAQATDQRVLEASERLLGEEHPDTLISLGNHASTLQAQGDLAGARALQERVLEACTRVQGQEHPDTLRAMNNLASTLWLQEDLPAARALQEEVLAARERLLGEEHPDTLIAACNLASTIWAQGDLADARALEERVLKAREQLLGADHPDTLIAMGNLAMTLSTQGHTKQAEALEQRVAEASARVLGPEHPSTLTAMGNLAGTLRRRGDLTGARALQEHVLAARERLFGKDHPHTLLAVRELASTRLKQGEAEAVRALPESPPGPTG